MVAASTFWYSTVDPPYPVRSRQENVKATAHQGRRVVAGISPKTGHLIVVRGASSWDAFTWSLTPRTLRAAAKSAGAHADTTTPVQDIKRGGPCRGARSTGNEVKSRANAGGARAAASRTKAGDEARKTGFDEDVCHRHFRAVPRHLAEARTI